MRSRQSWADADRRAANKEGSPDGYLFVTRGTAGPMIKNVLSDDVRKMTAGSWRRTAWAPIACRAWPLSDLKATATFWATRFLKTTRDLRVAAEAIVDDTKTVYDHYSTAAPAHTQDTIQSESLLASSAVTYR